ncbi:MAG: hypothetical protein KGD67_12405, partial [Candidatus Lokiarchaeota archaeon]|nr:hypothetical protein [Candidatus Lokiarchaeota archaeon]
MPFSPFQLANLYDSDNINFRERVVLSELDPHLNIIKIQVELTKEDIDFFWKLHKKVSNLRIKG